MSLITEFKQFAVRGNVIDLAVAVVIGTSFGKIVSSLVDGVIMPTLGMLNVVDISYKAIRIGDTVIKWGLFLQSIIDFTIIAFSIFLFVRFINKLRNKEIVAPVSITPEAKLLTEIRDLLKQKHG